MIPPLDLFHQLFHEEDGYTAILAVTDLPWPDIDVYRPDGQWCGSTNVENYPGRLAAVRSIIKWNKKFYRPTANHE